MGENDPAYSRRNTQTRQRITPSSPLPTQPRIHDDMSQQDLFRLYHSSVGQRDAWGNQASKVDARVEDEWDSIYVDCQDGADVDFQDFSFDGSGDLLSSRGSTNTNGGAEGLGMGRDKGGAITAAATVASNSRKEGGRWRASSSASAGVSTGGSRSALMAAMDAYQAEEDKEDGEESGEEGEGGGLNKGFDEEDIFDCAIRGRWTFENKDDPVRGTNGRWCVFVLPVLFPSGGVMSFFHQVRLSASFFRWAFSLHGPVAALCFPPLPLPWGWGGA